MLIDVYYDDQQNGRWGAREDPITRHLLQVEQNISRILAVAHSSDMPVVYAMNSSPRIALEKSEFGKHFERTWGSEVGRDSLSNAFSDSRSRSPEYGTPSTNELLIPSRLQPSSTDYWLSKHAYSGFFDTRLDTLLRNLGVDTVICGGLWLNVCVAATALDALYRNYRVILLRDCTLAGESGKETDQLPNTARWIEWFEEIVGYTITSEQLTDALSPKLEEETREEAQES
ncbi:MAG: cysteine hydrolase [Spirochaetaceae bacterium]|nr:cysteine hydrolase [Spirochaetaceae bacterium]